MIELPIPTVKLENMKAIAIRLKITMCPAEMATNNRIINDIGLVIIPIISTGRIINLIGNGTPGVQNICFQ